MWTQVHFNVSKYFDILIHNAITLAIKIEVINSEFELDPQWIGEGGHI